MHVRRRQFGRALLERRQQGVAALLQAVDDGAAALFEGAERHIGDGRHIAADGFAAFAQARYERQALRVENAADLADAAAERTENSLALLVDGLDDAVETVDDALLEYRDALVKRAGNLLCAAAERIVDLGCAVAERRADLVGAGGKGVGEGHGRGGDALTDFVHAALQGARHVAAAFGHDAGKFACADHERFIKRGGTRAERVVDTFHDGVEIMRDLRGTAGRVLFKRRKLDLDGAGRLAGPFGERFRHRSALHGDETIHLLEAAANGFGEAADIAGDAVGDFAATAHDVLERREAGAESLFHLARAGIHRGRQRVGCAVERLVDP